MVWSIEASFAVHMDTKSHTGNTLTLGVCSLISGLHKQKNNTTSLMLSKLHGVGDTVHMMERTSNFIKEQVE